MEDTSKPNNTSDHHYSPIGWSVTPQTCKFLDDLLHGKHDASLGRNDVRPGKEIARVYILRDERIENPDGEVLVTLDVCVEYRKTIAQQFYGKVTRANIRAYFDVKVITDWENLSDPCAPHTGLGELCEEDQLQVLNVFGVKDVAASLWFSDEMPRGSTRYDVHARHVDGDLRFYFRYAHTQPEPGKPTLPPIPIPVAGACDDDDLPF